MITQVAILMRDGRMLTLPRPARHPDLIWYASEILRYDVPIGSGKGDVQGFQVKLEGDRYHKFCYREPARRIAEEAGQLLAIARDSKYLFSEDVWGGKFDRETWLENNNWNLTRPHVPEIGQQVWYFEEYVGVFSGIYRGFDSEYEDHIFECDQGGAIEASHWMPKTDIKPDQPWINIYEESSVISK